MKTPTSLISLLQRTGLRIKHTFYVLLFSCSVLISGNINAQTKASQNRLPDEISEAAFTSCGNCYDVNGTYPGLTYYGYEAAHKTPSGGSSFSTFIGYRSGYSNTTARYNTFMGYRSGYSNTTGIHNTFIGQISGETNTTGNYNTFIGSSSGYKTTTGSNNTFMGSGSGAENTTGDDNTFMGSSSGYNTTTGSNNTFMGYGSGAENTTGDDNTFMGSSSGYNTTTARYNTFMGSGSGAENTTGNYNTFTGYYSGLSNFTGSYNTFMGSRSGQANTTGNNNTFMGNSSGRSNTEGSNNTFMGYQSGTNNIEGEYNTFIGYRSGYSNDTGNDNTFIGNSSGKANTTGNDNTFIGNSSGKANTTGNKNTFTGNGSGYNTTTGSANTFMGIDSGKANTTGHNNTFIGAGSGQLSQGSSNIFLGYQAGYNETGSNKLYIASSSTDTPLIYGEFNNKLLTVNGKLGIGTSSPSSNLEVYGIDAILEINGKATMTNGTTGTLKIYGARNASNNTFGALDFHNYDDSGTSTGFWAGGIRAQEDGNDDSRLAFYTAKNKANTLQMIIDKDGKVGIGTASPKAQFEVASETGVSEMFNTAYGTPSGSGIGGGYFVGRRAQGTQSSLEAIKKDNAIAVFGGSGYDGTKFRSPTAMIFIRAAEDWDAAKQGGYMSFVTTPKGKKTDKWKERMRITDNGNVGIGTTKPGNYKLAVEGKIGAREIEVTNTDPWPDFVFEENYDLKSLEEVESYIKANKHLPGVPSEAEVLEKGINLGQMDATLLQKIEELTLYLIALEKKNKALTRRLEMLEKQ